MTAVSGPLDDLLAQLGDQDSVTLRRILERTVQAVTGAEAGY